MKFEPVRRMSVMLDVENKPKKLGTLAWSNAERRTYFEYAANFSRNRFSSLLFT